MNAAPKKTHHDPKDEPGMEKAAELILRKEKKRIRREKKRRRKEAELAEQRRREQEEAQLLLLKKMQQSIEVIKWCIVGIAAVMFLGIAIGIYTLIQVQSKVSEIERQVDHVKESLSHPLESMGGMFGRELDSKLDQFLNGRKE